MHPSELLLCKAPLWGGVGGGGSATPAQVAPSLSRRITPRKREREQTESAARA
jgi:hypothetical protein